MGCVCVYMCVFEYIARSKGSIQEMMANPNKWLGNEIGNQTHLNGNEFTEILILGPSC